LAALQDVAQGTFGRDEEELSRSQRLSGVTSRGQGTEHLVQGAMKADGESEKGIPRTNPVCLREGQGETYGRTSIDDLREEDLVSRKSWSICLYMRGPEQPC